MTFNISNKYNKEIQNLFINHILSFILLENKNNVILNQNIINNEINKYLLLHDFNIDMNIGKYLSFLIKIVLNYD